MKIKHVEKIETINNRGLNAFTTFNFNNIDENNPINKIRNSFSLAKNIRN